MNACCHRALANTNRTAGADEESISSDNELETVLCSKQHMQYLQANLEMHRGFTTLSLTLGYVSRTISINCFDKYFV